MPEQVDIRQARISDEPAIRACAKAAYAQYVALIGKKPAPMVADFASLIEAEHVHVAVAANGSVMGFIVFYSQGRLFFLDNVAVRPDAVGKGVGKRLIDFCEDMASQANAKAIRLYTNEKMTANLSLYPHLGYREIERRREDGFNRVFFEKPIV